VSRPTFIEVKMTRANKTLIICIILLVSIPLIAMAAVKKHREVSYDQECADCHTKQNEAWLSGKHFEMGVQCVVCHGSLDTTFFVQPPVERCAGCHDDKVSELKKKSATMKCTSCHDNHTLAAKTKTPFHKKGDK
jgi:hypothetical protein